MRRLSGFLPRSSFQIGILLIFVTLVAGWGLFNKQRILTTIADGTELTVEFDRQYKLASFQSKAKIAGVPVGSVTDVEYADERAIVTIKMNDGDAEKLGTRPSAAIRPTTLLGGAVYIDLIPGGDEGKPESRIPVDRTSVPVELDRVLDVLDSDARAGLQSSITQSDDIMLNGGSEAFAGIIETAPAALAPTGEVLDALGGVSDGDLGRAVRDLAGVTRAVQGDGTQLDALLVSLAEVSDVLGSEAASLGAAIDDLPRTTTNARTALAELNVLLDTLEATAPELIPVANELDAMLSNLSPVLVDARPVIADLREVTADLTPALGDLAPMTADGRDIIDDVDGEVIERVTGPTLDELLSGHDGGINAGGSDTLMYQEFGYMLSGLAGMTMGVDSNGPFLNFSPALDVESVAGIEQATGLAGIEPQLHGEYGSPSMSDPEPAPVVVDTSDPADNALTPPSSSIPAAPIGQDGANPGVGGDAGGTPIDGNPNQPDGLTGDRDGATDDLEPQEVAAVGDLSEHENSPWKIPLVTIIAVAALIGWVLTYESYRARVKQQ